MKQDDSVDRISFQLRSAAMLITRPVNACSLLACNSHSS